MSRDTNSTNLRLLGSPVNLNNRSKRRDDSKKYNIRNRPRSALQDPIFLSDSYDRYKRPYSAGDKDYQQSTRSFLHTFNVELKDSKYNSTATPNNIKIVPPTTALLGDPRSLQYSKENNKDIGSNASDYGSEDTYMSLGTKIKARAQSPKGKKINNKNILKYKNPVKKDRKIMDNINQLREDQNNDNLFGVEVKFSRNNASSTNHGMLLERCSSPYISKQQFMSYYDPLGGQSVEDSLAGRVSFGSGASKPDVANAIDSYSHRLLLTKQQLSLVEEESTQEVESPTQNGSSLSTENSIEEAIQNEVNKNYSDGNRNGKKSALGETKTGEIPRDLKSRTYSSFYEEFQSKLDGFNSKMSDGTAHTDSGSKDSGYPDSDTNRPSSTKYKADDVNREHDERNNRPSSSSSNKEFVKNFLPDKNDYGSEHLNHSRLLYKDFFLRKEGHVAVAPLNSPISILNIPDPNETNNNKKDSELEYPAYLLNSTTKAYTSKVIEDYKKEIAAINDLHELTLKDIKTDTISPTPLDLDKLFDVSFEDKPNQDTASIKKENNNGVTNRPDTPVNRADIANVSTQELIQNYFKVKEGEYSKNIKKTGKNKLSNASASTNIPKMVWKSGSKDPKASPSKIQGHKNIFTLKTPSSARIEGVHNDKDVESWMSLSDPSPRVAEMEQSTSAAVNVNASTSGTNDNVTQLSQATAIIEPKPKPIEKSTADIQETNQTPEVKQNSSVLDIYSMLKEIESYGENPMKIETKPIENTKPKEEERCPTPKDNFMEIFQFLEKVEQSANDALSVVTTTTPATIPNLDTLLKLPHTELAQRLVTASLQLEERSCCIALLQESLTNHKEQMITKISNLEKQSTRTVSRVKTECEEAIKRHQAFIDQLINDKKTLNHRIEQLVEERRGMEERWRRSAASLESRYKLQLTNHHEKMLAAQQVARQRWVRQKAEKIKELTVKGLEGELREMAERQQKEVADLKMSHAEMIGKMQAKHAQELENLRRGMEEEREAALVKERQMASARLEKQILELEATYHEQRTRLINEMRAESERVATELTQREHVQTRHIEMYKEEQERLLQEKKAQLERDIAKQRENMEEQLKQKRLELEREFDQYKRSYEAEQQVILNRRVKEIAAQHKVERDAEIERAIERLEAEAQAGRKEMQDAMRRNKEQYETELQELGETEKATLRRYQEAQARVRQTEDKCAELEVAIGQLETRNKVLTERNIQLEEQVSLIKSSCEADWAKKLSEAKREMDEAKRLHEEQMHQLYAKVKVAVARKDSAIQALTRETSKYQEKVTLLEQKLQQQRKDFLKHK